MSDPVSQSTNHRVIPCLTKSTNHCLILCLTDLLQPPVPPRAVGVQTNSARCADKGGSTVCRQTGGKRGVQTNGGSTVCRQTGRVERCADKRGRRGVQTGRVARCADKRGQRGVQTNGGSAVCRQTGAVRCADKRGQRGVQTNSVLCADKRGQRGRTAGSISPPVFGSPRTLAPAQEGSESTAPADSVCQ